jgi:hypothetical protein
MGVWKYRTTARSREGEAMPSVPKAEARQQMIRATSVTLSSRRAAWQLDRRCAPVVQSSGNSYLTSAKESEGKT